MKMLASTPRFFRAHSLAGLLAVSAALSAAPVAAIQISALGVSNHSHDQFQLQMGDTPGSPFFTQSIDSNTAQVYTIGPSNGLTGSISAPGGTPTGSSTTVSGRAVVNGNATSDGADNIAGNGDDWLDGNRVPAGVTLSFDISFTISSSNGRNLITGSGNTGNGVGIDNDGTQNYGDLGPGEVLQFSTFTATNRAWGGTPTEPFLFTGGAIGDARLTGFRSNNLAEATEGATLSDGTNTIGFGVSNGTLASKLIINNTGAMSDNFQATPLGGALPLTLTTDAGAWNLKGFQLSLPVTYDIVPAPAPSDADFDDDGDVDGADFLLWQENLGVGVDNQHGDANASGTVDAADLAAWQTAFGTVPPPVASIPEPAAITLAAIGLLLAAHRKRR